MWKLKKLKLLPINFMEENVITLSQKSVNKSDCISIDGYWYIKEIEAVKLGEFWYPVSSPLIYQDYKTGKYVKKNRNTIRGIVDYTPKDGCIRSYFQSDVNGIVFLKKADVSVEAVINEEVLNKIPRVFNKTLGCDEVVEAANSDMEKWLGNCIGRKVNCYSFGEHYSSHELMPIFLKDNHRKVIDNVTSTIHPNYLKEWGDLTFGIEFETSAGNISEADCHRYGLMPLRDGSIKGHEYATIPLNGTENDFKLLLAQLKLLRENCFFDKDCSMHVHIGGFPIKEAEIFALYNLCLRLEEQVSRMFCRQCMCTSSFKTKAKDFCNPLPGKFNSFDDLYYFLSGGNTRYRSDLYKNHPQDNENRAKWNMGHRYLWVNLINLCFKKTGKTVEFRLHEPTFNSEKVINWLFICAAFLKYAQKHTNDILNNVFPRSLEDMLSSIYSSELAAELIKYYKARREFFELSYRRYSDGYGHYNLQLDPKITYGTNLIINV